MSASKTQDPGAHDGRAESDASRGGSAALATMGFVVALAVGFFAMRAYRTDSAAAEAIDPGPRQWVELRGDEPQVGPDDAIVTIVEFTDYECAYCARAHAPLEAVMREYEGDVRWVIKHMPMPRHQAAVSAARMAWAAHQQGRFFDLHPLLFDAQGALPEMTAAAEKLGLDLERLGREMETPEAGASVDADYFTGAKLRVTGTPTFFVNGHRYVGARQRNDWVEVLEFELTAARKAVKRGVPRAEVYRRLTEEAE